MKKNKLIKGVFCVFVGISGLAYSVFFVTSAKNEKNVNDEKNIKSNTKSNKNSRTIDVNIDYSNEVRDIYFKLLQNVFEWDETLDYMEETTASLNT